LEKLKAQQIINSASLISSKISRTILSSIAENKKINISDFEKIISQQEYIFLQSKYNSYAESVSQSERDLLPKHYPFYLILKEKFPNIKWEMHKKINGKWNVQLVIPRVRNLRPSLLYLLLADYDAYPHYSLNETSCSSSSSINKELLELSQLITDIEAIPPKQEEINLLAEWLLNGKAGRHVSIFIPVCPDYSAIKLKKSKYLYRYTLESLGHSNGIVAKRILQILPRVNRFLLSSKINFDIYVGLADFEGFSENICDRMRLTENEFLYKVDQSKNAFVEQCKFKVNAFMISKMMGGKDAWLAVVNNYLRLMQQGRFGKSGITQQKILDISRRKKPLYKRWHGKTFLDEEYVNMTLAQAAEYAAMGDLIKENFNNCLIIGADNSAMRQFYNYSDLIPMVYLKPFYE
jgi:hypothetical protein